MSGPANAVIGEEYGTDLPITQLPEQDLTEERKAAKFSKTAEYQRLKDHLQQRIEYYRAFLPGGDSVISASAPNSDIGEAWRVATLVITELQAIIGAYEQAQEVVRDAAKRAGA